MYVADGDAGVDGGGDLRQTMVRTGWEALGARQRWVSLDLAVAGEACNQMAAAAHMGIGGHKH